MKKIIFTLVLLITIIAAVFLAGSFNLLSSRQYSCSDFDIEIITSNIDRDSDGIDDYTDILIGAKKDAENKPRYDGRYYAEGFPPEDVGVCTDVIWRAFREAGYNLREMVDQDIIRDPDSYPVTQRDKNIDFRRVRNLRVFFDKYAEVLTTDLKELDQWQAGDIVVFNNGDHIGIVSDIRNSKGYPFIIHNGGQLVREEDYLKRNPVITAHYRWNTETIDPEVIVDWEE